MAEMHGEHYAIYYPDEGKYSRVMTIKEAKALLRMFTSGWIVNTDTAEIFG